jgi:2-dehydro-3-deoxyphosphogluconate aldolase / (4S)-4-hydroxy-2-oxoglutarate aldolase
MKNAEKIAIAIAEQGILPLYYNTDETVSVEILKTMYKAGIKLVEYTARGEAAFKNFKQLIKTRNASMKDMCIGIGTIKTLQQAEDYIGAGADFLVSPGVVNEVAVYAVTNDIFYAPGCMTPTEIINAENKGIGFIKLFPGNILGPEFLSSIKDIFPHLFFVPTGGVDITRQSIAAWYKAGACAVGMGSKLISKKIMADKNYDLLEININEVLEMIREVRKADIL